MGALSLHRVPRILFSVESLRVGVGFHDVPSLWGYPLYPHPGLCREGSAQSLYRGKGPFSLPGFD